MDHQFDRITRRFGGAISRRDGLRGLRAIAAALPFAAAAAPAGAKPGAHRTPGSRPGPAPEGPCGPSSADNKCHKDKDCCTGYCKPGKQGKAGRCRCVAIGKTCSKGQQCCGSGTCANGTCTKEPVGPSCTAATCPYGCCLDDVCQSAAASATTSACGSAGGACQTCTGSDLCFAGVCGEWSYQTRFGSTFGMTGPEAVAISADALTVAINDSASSTVFVATRASKADTIWTLQSQFQTFIDSQTGSSASYGIALAPDLKTIWVGNNTAKRITSWTRPSATSTTWTYQDRFGSDADTADIEGIVVSSDTLTLWATDYTAQNVTVWTRPSTATAVFVKNATFGNSVDTAWAIQSGVTGSTLTTLAPSNDSFVTVYTRPDATSATWSKAGAFGDAVTAKNAFNAMVSAGGTGSLVQGSDGVNVWTYPGAWTHQVKMIDKGTLNQQLNDSIGGAMTPDGTVAVFTDRGTVSMEVAVWIFQ